MAHTQGGRNARTALADSRIEHREVNIRDWIYRIRMDKQQLTILYSIFCISRGHFIFNGISKGLLRGSHFSPTKALTLVL